MHLSPYYWCHYYICHHNMQVMTVLVTIYKGQFVCGGGRSGAAHCLLFSPLPVRQEPHVNLEFTPVMCDSTAGSAMWHFMHGLPTQFLSLHSIYFQYHRTCTLYICIRIWIETLREPTFDYQQRQRFFPALAPTQHPVQWYVGLFCTLVSWLRRDEATDHSRTTFPLHAYS